MSRRGGAGDRRQAGRGTVDVALVVPLHGPAGMYGPSCELSAQLAARELNDRDGILGRPLRLVPVDGADDPAVVAGRLDDLVTRGQVDAVVGWHISAVRQAVAGRLAGRVPYVYTPLYEGGERSPGVYLTGETPSSQVLPALRELAQALGVRRWTVVGNDYVWPTVTAAEVRRSAAACGISVCDEVFVPLGCSRFGPALRRVEASGCQGVLMLLVGDDAVRFNREFTRHGLQRDLVRLSPLMEENMLLASGAGSTDQLYAAAGFFETLPTSAGLDFGARFTRAYGPQAPVLNSLGESCYEGLVLLAELARRAGSLAVPDFEAVADGLGFDSPRGAVRMSGRHLRQDVYLARADGLEFDVLCTLRDLPTAP